MLGVRLTGTEYERITRAASRLRAGGHTRRELLAGALAGGIVLAGCGVDEAAEQPPSDEQVLTGLLKVEQAAGAAVIGPAAAELIARQDDLHARRLATAAGLQRDDVALAPTRDVRGALQRKQDAVFAYVAALPRLADPEHRVLVMQIAASEAEHLVLLRETLGDPAVPDAFAGYNAGAP